MTQIIMLKLGIRIEHFKVHYNFFNTMFLEASSLIVCTVSLLRVFNLSAFYLLEIQIDSFKWRLLNDKNDKFIYFYNTFCIHNKFNHFIPYEII